MKCPSCKTRDLPADWPGTWCHVCESTWWEIQQGEHADPAEDAGEDE